MHVIWPPIVALYQGGHKRCEIAKAIFTNSCARRFEGWIGKIDSCPRRTIVHDHDGCKARCTCPNQGIVHLSQGRPVQRITPVRLYTAPADGGQPQPFPAELLHSCSNLIMRYCIYMYLRAEPRR